MLLRTIVEALDKRARRKEMRSVSRRKYHREQSSKADNPRTNMPLAYALARSWAWPALKFRCETHPHEVQQIAVDNRGETILHWTCLGKPPIDTVLAILKVCPEMTRVRNRVGHFPLHVAISYRASVEIVRALLEVFPESAGLSNGVGAYPLHLLCDYGSCVDSLSAVLETEVGAATIHFSMRGGGTPLNILNARMNYPVFRRAILSLREARKRQQAIREASLRKQQQQASVEETSNEASDMEALDTTSTNRSIPYNENNAVDSAALDRNERMITSFQQNDYWQKAALLVLVSYTQQPLSALGLQQAHLVHACAGIENCSSHLMEFAILLLQGDLKRSDEKGRLPLHVAARRHAKRLVATEEITTKRQRTNDALQRILEACPAAAHVPDAQGQLPLAVALKELRPGKCWSRGLQQLLEANWSALETLNLSESLYPHVWANRMTDADQIFQSIRRHPDLLDHSRLYTTITVGC